MNKVNSGIYEGTVRHRRYEKTDHQFCYKVFMMLCDIDNVSDIVTHSPFWSFNASNVVSFNEVDYLTMYQGTLREKVTQVLLDANKPMINGKVYLLSNWRMCGYSINPISIYYCLDNDNVLCHILLEVTNTPWKEKKVYVLDCNVGEKNQHINFEKELHVSPFFAMDMQYRLHANYPDNNISVHLENRRGEEKIFDATLALKKIPISSWGLHKIIMSYPIMTIKVVLGIYWQALRLTIKKIPFQLHPKKINKESQI